MLSRGLFDLQVNGFAGVDFNDSALTADALDQALHAMLRTGVTLCLPTLITATGEMLADRLHALDRAVARSRLGPLMVPGFHLEGPFLNPTPGYAGCHPAAAMVSPDPYLLARLTAELERPVLLITLAPELPDAPALIRWARGAGMAVAIGHSAASAQDIDAACAAGAGLSTHLGNALPQPQPKFLNPLMAQLAEDRLAASFIADGIHIPPAALKVLLRAKTMARSILVTDATAAAATPPGIYHFAEMMIEHAADGSVREPGSPVLAGSALTLDQAVRNLVAWGLAEAKDAISSASDRAEVVLTHAFAHHAICPDHGSVRWSDALQPAEIFLDALRINTG